ncbi:hypothetical protein LCGC14_1000320 [marine sediment metagenome]|uniref:Antitoxin of toxin-antitoxin stability system n=1 Tax=marine sediment metagenome TaxID=412755 RepID=A0A0F9QLM5_9ZZZZ
MRIDIVETKVYKFDELSDEAKQTALDGLRENCHDYEWWDYIFEDAKEIGKLVGIDIDNIYFSGFSSKGDGACFEGNYGYKTGSVKAVLQYAPQDEELHRITEELLALQKKCLYQIRASVKQSGHYNHRFCTDFSVDFESHATGIDYYNKGVEEAIIEVLRDYMHWIYKQLETQNDYMMSDEAIKETIEANKYEFIVDGELYYT